MKTGLMRLGRKREMAPAKLLACLIMVTVLLFAMPSIGKASVEHGYLVVFMNSDYSYVDSLTVGENKDLTQAMTADYISKLTPPGPNATFQHWYVGDDEKVPAVFPIKVNSNVILYAAWSGATGVPVIPVETAVETEYQFNPEDLAQEEDPWAATTQYNGYDLNFVTDHIEYLYGYPEGDVRPDHNITRAEAAVIFYRLLASYGAEESVASSFADVNEADWFYQPVAYLELYGIIEGNNGGLFRPNDAITRAEYAALASRFDMLTENPEPIFTDVGPDHWAVGYIGSAALRGWVYGHEDNTFRPQHTITRAEVVSIVNRMLNRTIRLENIPDDAPFYTDLPRTHWAYADIIEASNSHEFVLDSFGTEVWTRYGIRSRGAVAYYEQVNEVIAETAQSEELPIDEDESDAELGDEQPSLPGDEPDEGDGLQ